MYDHRVLLSIICPALQGVRAETSLQGRSQEAIVCSSVHLGLLYNPPFLVVTLAPPNHHFLWSSQRGERPLRRYADSCFPLIGL